MGILERSIRGAQAGAVAAAGVALSFFVLDLMRLQPMGTLGTISGAFFGPGGFEPFEVEVTNLSGVVGGLATAFKIATFTAVHFLAFALVGVLASLLFDWKSGAGLKPLLVVAVLCTLAFSATVAGSGSLVALESVGPVAIVGVNLLAAMLLVGYLRLAAMPEPEEPPPT